MKVLQIKSQDVYTYDHGTFEKEFKVYMEDSIT